MPSSRTLRVAVGLGSTAQFASEQFRFARARLLEAVERIEQVSAIYETAAVGPAGTSFQNAVLILSTNRPLESLLALCHEIEADAGRLRGSDRWQSRPLDLDLIAARDRTQPVCVRSQTLSLPHPLAWVRRFVLDPLIEIEPTFLLRDDRSALEWWTHWQQRPIRVWLQPETPIPASLAMFVERATSAIASDLQLVDRSEEPLRSTPLPRREAIEATLRGILDQPQRVVPAEDWVAGNA